MNIGQKHKEVCLTMVKMSGNRKCQIPKGKTSSNSGSSSGTTFLCDEIILYSPPKGKTTAGTNQSVVLGEFSFFKVQNKSKSNNIAFMSLLAGNLTLLSITFLWKKLNQKWELHISESLFLIPISCLVGWKLKKYGGKFNC